MSTILTWCESCDVDMHVEGGDTCEFCGGEYCLDCIDKHFCPEKEEQEDIENEDK